MLSRRLLRKRLQSLSSGGKSDGPKKKSGSEFAPFGRGCTRDACARDCHKTEAEGVAARSGESIKIVHRRLLHPDPLKGACGSIVESVARTCPIGERNGTTGLKDPGVLLKGPGVLLKDPGDRRPSTGDPGDELLLIQSGICYQDTKRYWKVCAKVVFERCIEVNRAEFEKDLSRPVTPRGRGTIDGSRYGLALRAKS